MTIKSELLGDIEIPEEDFIQLPNGLFGFPECREFLLVKAERNGLFWLQSVEHSALTFLLADPFVFFDDYSVDIDPDETGDLQIDTEDDVIILIIVTLPQNTDEAPTANLQGPVLFNLKQKIGRQMVLQESDFGTRHELKL